MKELAKIVLYEDPLLESRFITESFDSYNIEFEDEEGKKYWMIANQQVIFEPHLSSRNYYCYHFTEDVVMVQDVIEQFMD